MEEHCYVLPSNIYLPLNSFDPSRPRVPLTDSTGNAQYHAVASTNIYSDQKGLQPRAPPNFLLPTLPSQPARSEHRTLLEARKSRIKSEKKFRGSRPNPIIESKNYQDYRSRQIKGKNGDQKWPDDLEDLFLEALCLLPNMGRRKFSLNGKPHGRNELVSNWLWLGYCESLRPGQVPDESRRRTRKQVSSHIQVLKGFMRGHVAFDRLFPARNTPKNGFEDSFKNDPSLRALAAGHLPHRRSSHAEFNSSIKNDLPSPLTSPTRQLSQSPHYHSQCVAQQHCSLRPSLFKMYMTTLRPGVDFKDVPEDDAGDGKLSTKVHTYTDSIPRAMGYSLLETLPDWQTRFPILAQIHSRNDLNCDVIHIEVSLELRYGCLPERSELWGKFHLLMPGEPDRQTVWRCTQNFYKPPDLYGPPTADPRFENVTSTPNIDRYEPGVGTHIRVSFPALPWAYALQRLSTLEAQFDEAVQTGAPLPTPTTARQYIDQITMFQEIYCSAAPNLHFARKAILLWTFKKCKAGEQGLATWRYLDHTPPRSSCFSPHPGTAHVASAAMSENFAAWGNESAPSSLQVPPSAVPNPFDALASFDSLPTPSLQSMVGSADLQFPFSTYGYPSTSTENLSFMSHDTHDSDSTLVNARNGVGGGAVNLDPFLSAASVLPSFDQGGNFWEAQAAEVQSFESDPAFLAGFGGALSTAGGHVWDTTADVKGEDWHVGDEAKHESWAIGDAGLLSFETMDSGDK